jgi:hypothetical protein
MKTKNPRHFLFVSIREIRGQIFIRISGFGLRVSPRYTSKTLATLILTAVQMETRAVQQTLRHRRTAVHTAGIRAGHLPDPIQLANVSLIIMCGVAGALDPSLHIGDCILDDRDHRIPDSPFYRRGRIHTASEIIASPHSKGQLFAETGALAVEMEQAIVRKWAAPFEIPVIGLRAISDTADQMLDPAVVNLVDDLGRPRGMKIATTLIRRPGLIPYLNRLNANSKLALKNLGAALVEVIGHSEADV